MNISRRMGQLFVLLTVLSACASPARPTASPSPAPPNTPTVSPAAPSSDELIDAAAGSGQINPEAALTYKVFALFSDPRLPAQFKGNPSPSGESHVIDDVQAGFTQLSPETQKTLLPFLMPPAYKGSWADPNLNGIPDQQQAENASRYPTKGLPCNEINDQWASRAAMHAPVRFWWQKTAPADEQTADRMIAAMDSQIWTKLTVLMGRVPKPDGGTPCNGGGPELDVYLTPLVSGAITPYDAPPGCKDTPAFIVINSGETDSTLAHEFMHAIQWAYPVANGCMYPGDYAWLAEATATWAEDYVYPSTNGEWEFVNSFYHPAGEPTLPLYEPKGFHQYGAYLYFFYLTRHFGQPEIVSRAWANTTTTGSVEAVDLAIPGGYADTWGDFAIENLIEQPRDDYQKWDTLTKKPVGKSVIIYNAKGGEFYELPTKILPLAIHYEEFNFSSDATLVTFFNGLGKNLDQEFMDNEMLGVLPIKDGTTKYKFSERSNTDGLKIQAYFKVEGDSDWQLEDWTDKETVSFCRDASDERLTNLVIVVSNSSKDQTISQTGSMAPAVSISKVGCYRYSGTASLEMTGTGNGGAFNDLQEVTGVTFERTDTHPNIPYPVLHFQVIEGSDRRAYSFEGADCSGHGEKTSALGPRNKYELSILYGAINGRSKNRYSGNSDSGQPVTVNFQCKDSSPTMDVVSLPWFYIDALSAPEDKVFQVSSDGVIDGSDELLQIGENATMQYKWHFEPVKQEGGGGDSSSGSPPSNMGGSNFFGGGGTAFPTPPSGFSTAMPTLTPIPLKDMPLYPNVISSYPSPNGMVIITPDPVVTALQFYRKEMVKLGWTDKSMPVDPSNPFIQLMYMKDNTITLIAITSSEGNTTIMITQVRQ